MKIQNYYIIFFITTLFGCTSHKTEKNFDLDKTLQEISDDAKSVKPRFAVEVPEIDFAEIKVTSSSILDDLDDDLSPYNVDRSNETTEPLVNNGTSIAGIKKMVVALKTNMKPNGLVHWLSASIYSLHVGISEDNSSYFELEFKRVKGGWKLANKENCNDKYTESGIELGDFESLIDLMPDEQKVLNILQRNEEEWFIMTGEVNRPLSGRGKSFHYKKENNKWVKIYESEWIS